MPGHSDLMYWLKPTLLMSEGFRAVPDKIPSHTSSLLESGSRKTPKQSRRTRRKHVKAPSRSSGQLTGTREALERPYLCNTCGERYAQRQGVNRHFRAKHNPSSCVYCGVKWSRPYQYRNHIEKQHPNIDPDLVLGKASSSRRKATVIGREQPQHVSIPAIRRERRIQAVSLCPPLTPSPPAVANITHAPPTFSSTGGHAQPLSDVVDHASRLPLARSGRSTVPDRSSRAVTPTLPPPVSGYYDSSVVIDPVIELSGLMHPYSFFVGAYDEIWTVTPRARPHNNIDPRRCGLDVVGAVEPYGYEPCGSAYGIAFRESDLLDCSIIKSV